MDVVVKSAKRAGELLAIVNEHLAHTPWLSGTDMGIGDMPVGVYAHTYFTIDIDRPALPHLRAWYEQLAARAAYARTVMIPLS
jgi:glutathione S-transferase